ncbi:putative ankyrin repeat-containing domain, PGG domain, ankyrin repeat-containing domain superfamily [Helianthus annuus]|uniref:uncharacterized protein LOC110928794 isoform X2 n=1 Tax=Helianthus annuus TaxID=4232 RepID=UPI000B8F17A1|nr:uncharacterized protein LOC110928794 isoform X2 [Helianthus annuus]KAJ0606792.1 putative ankyrin repeat-containing domain, PGG domain, ankyrin repeat-containing domain superfamily [Helianthus annuus]KAJ0766851.1 putative ankyrin repeat-containing domain, PGG domain, ankyrin repeat-containing domain superfamily [Helianthus annuus]KAJ0934152.1 putative ankyrin repeat-containing domain, PGG domain, ankyrin repeat-containing domain superfamily [Helianthus annuus]
MEMAGSSNAPDVSTPTHDMKFMQASNINVSNFVSVKLSGLSNYKIWKAQMLCLIKSQVLLHIIDANHPFPVDKDVHMIEQYNELVKGWIFGSVNENELKDLVDMGTAQEVWMKLESLFNLPVSDTEGVPSNVIDVSTRTEDLRYMLASNVDVSDFVSVKLTNYNYDVWKSQILCLIESHDLLHIIHAKARFPWDKGDPMTQAYDKLVRGWILNTITNYVLEDFHFYRSVQLLWRNLELRSASAELSLPASAELCSPSKRFAYTDEADALIYKQASNIKVSNFVPVKLSVRLYYHVWKDQMLRLIESQDLLHVIHINIRFPKSECDKLVKDWILGSMNEELVKDFTDCDSAKDLWTKLESHFTDGDSWPDSVVSASTQDLKYTQASTVNVSNFISVKLSGQSNYPIWKLQMLFLIKSQELVHVIQQEGLRILVKYDNLVKGWIFSTMSEDLFKEFIYLEDYPVSYVWNWLANIYDRPKSEGVTFGIEFIKDAPDIDTHDIETESSPRIRETQLKKELYKAAAEGWWRKAKSILENNKFAATEAITANGNTILHVGVEMGHNYFVEKLLEFLEDVKDIEMKNDKGQTALHIAAIVGNTHAAQLLVQKSSQLLEYKDNNNVLPMHLASANTNLDTYAYLFESRTPPCDSHFESYMSNQTAFLAAIFSKHYDLAETLLKESPNIAMENEEMLKAITTTFPTDLGFRESLIYPSFHYVCQKTVVRCSLLFHPDRCVDNILRVVKICNNTGCNLLGKNSVILLVLIATLYPIYQLICLLILLLHLSFSMLYLLLWKVLAITVPPIKNIEKKRKEYKKAKNILSLICKMKGPSDVGYSDSFFEAVRQDRYEVVDEILMNSPDTINLKDADGYNIIQLSIMNRAEKVYNLIYHIIERTKSRGEMTDSSSNNLAHLAGRLAPSFVLSRTTGAALQLQRELLWFKEVERLMLPLKLMEKNIYNETPVIVFAREHHDLLKQGEIWMKTTAESSSITAALIVTVAFAAAITVPGGSNQESGIPVFGKEIPFIVFAVSNASSLFTGVTALLLFLSTILTASSSEKDFQVILPRRLIFGLVMLFLSAITMMVAFGAIFFLVFCDRRPWMLAPIAVFACWPILVIVAIKLPLLANLIQSTFFPLFGEKSYLKSCNINKKNTIFI